MLVESYLERGGGVVADLSEDKAQSEEEDDREDGQDAGYGHSKQHRQLLLLGWGGRTHRNVYSCQLDTHPYTPRVKYTLTQINTVTQS